jgi:hypothetical protein
MINNKNSDFNLLVQNHKSITIINPEIISSFVFLVHLVEAEIVHSDFIVLPAQLVLDIVDKGPFYYLFVRDYVGRQIGRDEMVPEIVIR